MIIKHNKFLDIAIEIDKPILKMAHKWRIRGKWVNQGFVETYDIGIRCNIDIKTQDLKDWLICNEPNLICIRYADWRKLC